MFRIVFAAALLCVPSIAYAETCIASHYGVGDGYGGRRTANGEIMIPRAMTAAHKTRPFSHRLQTHHLLGRDGRNPAAALRAASEAPTISTRVCIAVLVMLFAVAGLWPA